MGKIIIRRTHWDYFHNCPRKYYWAVVEKVRLKPQFLPLPVKRGQYFHSLVTGQKVDVIFTPDEEREKKVVEVMVEVMKDLSLIPFEGVKGEKEFKKTLGRVTLTGTLDFYAPEYFIELKYTSHPEFYLNSFSAKGQLEFYFFISGCSVGVMLPVRVPSLRFQDGKEDEGKYLERVKADIYKRPSFYFPYFAPTRLPAKWGLKFYSHEFNFSDFKSTALELASLINRSIRRQRFLQNRFRCLMPTPCQYLPICSSDDLVNWEIYEREDEEVCGGLMNYRR